MLRSFFSLNTAHIFFFQYNFGKTIIDSGTTNLRLPTKVYNTLIANLRNTIQVNSVKNLKI